METIAKADCIKIGYLQRQHGLKGELQLRFEPQFGDSLEVLDILYLECDGLLVPFFIREAGFRFRSNESALVHFEWVNNELEAKKLNGTSVFIHEDDYIRTEENFSLNELVGFLLFDAELGAIGHIKQVDDYAGNLLFTVQYNEKEVMVPFNDDFLVRLDEDKKEIEIKCPAGIFDI